MSDTPLTDEALLEGGDVCEWKLRGVTSIARQLERENAELREVLKIILASHNLMVNEETYKQGIAALKKAKP